MVIIDRVYQKVLALANREQRGYITPQEFNLFADHAQMEIFEEYFYDLERATRSSPSHTEYTDKATAIDEKLSLFEEWKEHVTMSNSYGDLLLIGLNIYRLSTVMIKYKQGDIFKQATRIDPKDFYKLSSPLLNSYSLAGPYYIKHKSGNDPDNFKIKIYPNVDLAAEYNVRLSYIEKPLPPNWTYFVSPDGAALYNPASSDHRNFSLHSSEENNLVIKILQLAGVSTKDYQLMGVAAQADAKAVQLKNK